MKDDIVKTDADMKILRDKLMNSRNGAWWDGFYTDKGRDIPFFVSVPDENLKQYVESGQIQPGDALDIGCGNGRNSLYQAQNGFSLTGIDFSKESVDYAKRHHMPGNSRTPVI